MQPLYLIAAFAIFCIVATFLGRLFWAFEFANYFVLHGSAVLVIVASLLLLARKRFEAAVCLAFAVIGMFYVVPLYITVKPQSSCEPVQRAIL